MQKIAISIGDLNGIGIEIALRNHSQIKQWCEPIYVVDTCMASQCAKLLGLELPDDFECVEYVDEKFDIVAGSVCASSGAYSYASFVQAVDMVKSNQADAVMTLPINKEAWSKAGIKYKGHTDALDSMFDSTAIMMLGCEELFVLLYTHHIPLRDVAKSIDEAKLVEFLHVLHSALDKENIGVLGLNPHAGDGGVIGDEDIIIQNAINQVNKQIGKDIFVGPLVPDTAFVGKRYKHIVAMYHDQGLTPLKALYFEDSINVSLHSGVKRASVDHGTAYDRAYKNANISYKSYQNAIKYLLEG